MKLLLSCYECSPIRGSEGGIGWNWAYEARRLGHDVWVLVSPAYETEIRAACDRDPIAGGIRWIFPQARHWTLAAGSHPSNVRRHNYLWQKAALGVAADLCREIRFDAVQHVTWGGIRYPSLLWKLPVPFVLGPVGGGETSPRLLRDAMSLRNRSMELVRDLSNATLMLNPPVRGMLKAAKLIATRTSESLDALPVQVRNKSFVYLGIGTSSGASVPARVRRSGRYDILFAGRLLYWKGVHLALAAFQHVLKELPEARFSIVGRGPEESDLRSRIARYGLSGSVGLIPWVRQAELYDLYRNHDLFLFPSLHDSGGCVVLESLTSGLPVVCLDIGGPRAIVDDTCGVVVPTGKAGSAEVARRLGEAVLALLADPDRWQSKSDGALLRARDLAWTKCVGAFYEKIETLLN